MAMVSSIYQSGAYRAARAKKIQTDIDARAQEPDRSDPETTPARSLPRTLFFGDSTPDFREFERRYAADELTALERFTVGVLVALGVTPSARLTYEGAHVLTRASGEGMTLEDASEIVAWAKAQVDAGDVFSGMFDLTWLWGKKHAARRATARAWRKKAKQAEQAAAQAAEVATRKAELRKRRPAGQDYVPDAAAEAVFAALRATPTMMAADAEFRRAVRDGQLSTCGARTAANAVLPRHSVELGAAAHRAQLERLAAEQEAADAFVRDHPEVPFADVVLLGVAAGHGARAVGRAYQKIRRAAG